MNTETLLWFLWTTLMVLLLVGAVLMKWFYRRLEEYHREAWMELGSPTLILNNSMANQRRINRFLWSGAYRDLADPTLDRLALAARVFGGLSVLLFLAGAAIVVSDL